jgi:hypothetical protein
VVPYFYPINSRIRNGESSEENNVEMSSTSKSSSAASIIGSPRCPSASWLKGICNRQIKYISSFGCKVFVVVDEETASSSLMKLIYKKLTGEAKFSVKEESDSSRTIDDEDSIFETRGKADCLLIASGKTFLCHKAILAHRSMELRNMIMMEFTTNENYFNLPVQILLPELQKDSTNTSCGNKPRRPSFRVTSNENSSSLSGLSLTQAKQFPFWALARAVFGMILYKKL